MDCQTNSAMDTKEIRVASPIFVALGLLVLVILLLTLLDTCNGYQQPVVNKVDTTYVVKRDTIRIVDVKYKPVPKWRILHDTNYIYERAEGCNDTLLYMDTIKSDNGVVYLNEVVSNNEIQNRQLFVDCFNTDTIVKIEKQTTIKKTALVKVIPGVFAWGSHSTNMWGGGVQLHALFADRYLLGAAYDIKNGGIHGSFGVKISIKRK